MIVKKSKLERIIETGLEAKALGKDLMLIGARFNYCGTVVEIGGEEHDGYIVFDGAKMPGETGPLEEKKWKVIEKFPFDTWNVSVGFIESWGVLK